MTIHDDLVARYGQPERMPDRVEGQVFVFAHATEESARAYAAANAAVEDPDFAYPTAIEEDFDRWLTVVDIRPALERLNAEFTDGGPA